MNAQFKLGEYLKSLDPDYSHPAYQVDFLLRFQIKDKQRDIILEYDGFEFHFDKRDEVDASNWEHYQKDKDIERERILESYGYKTLRLNRFNVGRDPVETLNSRIEKVLDEYEDPADALTKKILDDTLSATEGLEKGTMKVCNKCNQTKPLEEFELTGTSPGSRRIYCRDCHAKSSVRPKKSASKKKQ